MKAYGKPRFVVGGREFRGAVIGDSSLGPSVTRRKSRTQLYAKRRRQFPTPAERHLAGILKVTFSSLEWIAEWAFDGKWILDFYCPEASIGIEVDGKYHETRRQRQKDKEKTRACDARGIALVRVTNAEVFGERVALIKKIRYGFLLASRYRSRIVEVRS